MKQGKSVRPSISKGPTHSFIAALPLYTDRGIVELQHISVIGSILVAVLLKSQEPFSVLPRQRGTCVFPRDVSACTMNQTQTTHHSTRLPSKTVETSSHEVCPSTLDTLLQLPLLNDHTVSLGWKRVAEIIYQFLELGHPIFCHARLRWLKGSDYILCFFPPKVTW